MKEKLSTDMDKKIYMKPTMHWVWIGLDKKIADESVDTGYTTSGGHDGLPGSDWGSTKEEEDWTEDAWNSAPGGSGVWEKGW